MEIVIAILRLISSAAYIGNNWYNWYNWIYAFLASTSSIRSGRIEAHTCFSDSNTLPSDEFVNI